MLASFNDETIAPSAGLSVRTERVVSRPDGNTINIQLNVLTTRRADALRVFMVAEGRLCRVTTAIIRRGAG
jgi:hypothetical protein